MSGSVRLTVGEEQRRLAVKSAVAAADLIGFGEDILDEASRNYLLSGTTPEVPVRMDFQEHVALQKLRPNLCHSIFVKGNETTGRCYAVVEFFSAVQLYVILNETSYRGPDFGTFGSLEILTGKETFSVVEPLLLHEPPRMISKDSMEHGMLLWMKKLETAIRESTSREVSISATQL